MKTFYFLSGLPRSGSTLLSSILNQNPEIHASPNSPMCVVMSDAKDALFMSEQYAAYQKPKVVQPMLYGIIEGFYSDVENRYVIDKSRSWSTPYGFNTLMMAMPYRPKIIIMVRDILEILASFIKINNGNPDSFIDREIKALNLPQYRSLNDTRCDSLMRPGGTMDTSLSGIGNAMIASNKDYFHFVEYNDLVNNPKNTIDKIYNFLEIDSFDHNFYNIENKFMENDLVYGINGLHSVKPKIEKSDTSVQEVLSEYVIGKYKNLEFWRQ
jgi:sulfotransferase